MLQGKVILVTGGTSGLGAAIAREAARSGATLVVSGRDASRGHAVVDEIRSAGGTASFLPAERAHGDEVERLVAASLEQHGRIDGAVNNAGIEGPIRPLTDLEEPEVLHVLDVNLVAVWRCLRSEIGRMLTQSPPGGAIVNTSSVNGFGGVPGSSIYAASRAGVLALTKSAALEVAARGIRVNALVAGAFRTPMLDRVMTTASGGDPGVRETVEKQYTSFVPMGRIGEPAEAARVAVWLLSDAASYVTGHSMTVDGGLTAPWR